MNAIKRFFRKINVKLFRDWKKEHLGCVDCQRPCLGKDKDGCCEARKQHYINEGVL